VPGVVLASLEFNGRSKTQDEFCHRYATADLRYTDDTGTAKRLLRGTFQLRSEITLKTSSPTDAPG
jgi:hypothetical protein